MTNSDPWSDDSSTSNRTNNRTSDNRRTTCADAARPVHAGSADYGIRFRCRQGNEATYQY